jgi:hypothetical protein
MCANGQMGEPKDVNRRPIRDAKVCKKRQCPTLFGLAVMASSTDTQSYAKLTVKHKYRFSDTNYEGRCFINLNLCSSLWIQQAAVLLWTSLGQKLQDIGWIHVTFISGFLFCGDVKRIQIYRYSESYVFWTSGLMSYGERKSLGWCTLELTTSIPGYITTICFAK